MRSTSLGGVVASGTVGALVSVSVLAVLTPVRCGFTVRVLITIGVLVVVLSPLVIISLEPSGVLGVIVRTSLDGIVRLAPPGVLVLTVSLLGPVVVIVTTSSLSGASRGALPRGAGFAVSVASMAGLGVLASGGLATVGGCLGGIAVLAPCLGAPLIVILVVPLIVRLGSVALGAGVVERDLLMEVLIAAPSVPVGALATPVAGLAGLGGGFMVDGVTGLGVSGSFVAIGVVLALAPGVAILSPLVVISANLTGVVLVIVRASFDGVERLAPTGVGIGALSLLGPCIVVVSRFLLGSLPGRGHLVLSAVGLTTVRFAVSSVSGSVSGGSVSDGVSLAVSAVGTVGTVGTVAVALGGCVVGVMSLAVSSDGTVRALSVSSVGLGLLGVVVVRGIVVLRRSTIGVLILAPGLCTMVILVFVVPLIVGLGTVGLRAGGTVGLVNGEILIATPSIPVGGHGLLVVGTSGLGGSVLLGGLLDDLGVRNVVDLGVTTVSLRDTVTVARAVGSGGTVAVASSVAGRSSVALVAVATIAVRSLDCSDESSSENARFHYA